ncbi:phosphoribosyl-ATP diphosphatase [Chitinibacter sp. FCG-7]|uniref:Phosphoribosyl-ATP pyrophosphatase n=1 Tax=Chitinibacter mangrovi TaxID=3153927 RepID=A0AAU7FCT5_9NEIS
MISAEILERLSQTLAERRHADASTSYVAKLYSKGQEAILKKVGEEAVETIMAAKDGDKLHLVREVADLWFHTLVLLSYEGLSHEDVLAELARREGISGIEEKAARKPA